MNNHNSYSIKEAFYTLQGEGAQSGRAAVFCRFSGCNLWSGRHEDRKNAICQFCDTDFVGTDGLNGGKYTAERLSQLIQDIWLQHTHNDTGKPYVVFTGGEPLLQLDDTLINQCKKLGFEIAIESNGTCPVPVGVDWVCISPKAGTDLVVFRGDELKLVYPQSDALPELYADLDFKHFFLQPKAPLNDDADIAAPHTKEALEYCLAHPQWRLSLQTHKLLDIP
ncbi:MAG: 7-carboxy-7-deazaguanine synthase [Kordiimonas sp.]|nr:7-carboxy-7-deazaguanine synthase [Kordiimonas sp.]|tara:strand:+ start:3689 stop:4357 length:669 start_codon:yes stop_codon:yes gene_type:complete